MDLAKLGVLLIGIALIIIASVFLHFYVTYLSKTFQTSYMVRPFTSHCSFSRVIIIEAHQELRDIRVFDNSSNLICSFDKIVKNSEEMCNVKYYGVYMVQHTEFKDVVECSIPVVTEPRSVD
ncbi:MAG: hypothetical protein NZ929_03395 [Aigarchaeota archaeon]|nr:hypothetical protein [Aigarchaeota archaeon]MCX8192867.1 hypothetical protein [Nitrososphaeria archaeon]MDW7986595.1 hypothetical protein [Nitrososphaerota archaeon]